MITVKAAECHEDTCLDVTGVNEHTANVNPVAFTARWRVDCDDCGTCVRVLDTKADALEIAKGHVKITPDEYWRFRESDRNPISL